MDNALATAVVAALVSGVANIAQTAVQDAYAALKNSLSELIPRFQVGDISEKTAEAKRDELQQRLGGLLEDERRELAEASGKLAAATDHPELASALQGYLSISGNEAKADIRVKLERASSEIIKIESNKAGRSIHVESRTIITR